jgi:hypothetical protein
MAWKEGSSIRAEISNETISRLLAEGHVCAEDFRCLDIPSKLCLRQLCLKSCAQKMKASKNCEKNETYIEASPISVVQIRSSMLHMHTTNR